MRASLQCWRAEWCCIGLLPTAWIALCSSGPGPRPRRRELWPLLQGWLPQVPERCPVCGELSAVCLGGTFYTQESLPLYDPHRSVCGHVFKKEESSSYLLVKARVTEILLPTITPRLVQLRAWEASFMHSFTTSILSFFSGQGQGQTLEKAGRVPFLWGAWCPTGKTGNLNNEQ